MNIKKYLSCHHLLIHLLSTMDMSVPFNFTQLRSPTSTEPTLRSSLPRFDVNFFSFFRRLNGVWTLRMRGGDFYSKKTSWYSFNPNLKNMSQTGNVPQIGVIFFVKKNIFETITQYLCLKQHRVQQKPASNSPKSRIRGTLATHDPSMGRKV